MKYGIAIILPIIIILFSFTVVYTTTNTTGEGTNVMDYLNNGNTSLLSSFTQKEITHLQDVKDILDWTNIIFLISLALFIIFIYTTQNISKELIISSSITLAILLLLSINFSLTFTYFHKLLFAPGTWLFQPDSLIIQTFPFSFFRSTFTKIMGLSAIISIITLVLSSLFFRRKKAV